MAQSTILVGEVRTDLATQWRDIVERLGFRALVSGSGTITLSRAKVLQPALVLLSKNIETPGSSETARRLKEGAETSWIPVVLLTTHELLEWSYPVEACLSIDSDPGKLADIVRVLARKPVHSARGVWSTAPLEGSVEGDLFRDVLQYLFFTKKSGRLDVRHAQTRGAIYIDRGQVLHAEFGAARGRQAFFEACLLERGRFRFWPSIAAPTTSIDESGIELLMTLTQCIDQARHATDTPKPTRVGSGHNRSGHR